MKKISILFFIITLTFIISACKKSPEQGTITGHISFLNGDVQINGKKASHNQKIKYGNTVTTGKYSNCYITFDKLNIIKMTSNAKMKFLVKEKDSSINLLRGFMGLVIKNKKRLKNFRVITPTITASVRGTVFYIGAETPKRTYSCICNGKIKYDFTGKTLLHQAKHHYGGYFTEAKGKISFNKGGGWAGHSFKFMDELASRINIKIDWTKLP
ncbi:FecR domain-containing protein [Spirochaetota bacterium]